MAEHQLSSKPLHDSKHVLSFLQNLILRTLDTMTSFYKYVLLAGTKLSQIDIYTIALGFLVNRRTVFFYPFKFLQEFRDVVKITIRQHRERCT